MTDKPVTDKVKDSVAKQQEAKLARQDTISESPEDKAKRAADEITERILSQQPKAD